MDLTNLRLQGKGFIVRPFRHGDESSLQKNLNDKDVAKYTAYIPFPYTEEHACSWVERSIFSLHDEPLRELNLVVDIDGSVVGSISLKINGHKAEIGYWLSKRFWDRGITSEAVYLIVDFCFSTLNLSRVYAYVHPDNIPSIHVLEKNGFVKEGFLRKDIILHDKSVDRFIYAIVR